MKKISILSTLGVLVLATLPVVAVVSCSSSTGTDSNLTTEVAKFEKSFGLKEGSKDTTIEVANNSINSAEAGQAKWDALGKLVELPAKSNDFTYDVKTSSVDTDTSSLKVVITIIQTSNGETKNLTLTITGFKASTTPSLNAEITKFKKEFPLNTASQNTTLTVANNSINSASEGKAKWDALAVLVDLPPTSAELFKYEVKSSSIDNTNSTLKVMMTITQLSDNKAENLTLTVIGFKAETSPALDKEVEKFNKSLSLLPTASETTLEAANSSITTADAGKPKWDALAVLVNLPTTDATLFDYEVKSTTPDNAKSELKVLITITQKSDSKTKDATLTITGFKPVVAPTPSLDAEIAKFQKPFPLNAASQNTTLDAANNSIATATEGKPKWDALAALVVLPEISDQFTYTIKSTTPDTTKLELSVVITITQTSDAEKTRDATLTITGFKPVVSPTPTLEDVVTMFTTSSPAREATEISTVINNLNKETNQQDKLVLLKTFVTAFPVSPEGFEIIIGIASEAKTSETSVEIAITVKQKSDNATKPATFTITGLTAKTPIEKEADKFLVTFAASSSESLITTAIRSINEAENQTDKYNALSGLVDKFPQVSNAFDLIIGTAAQDANEPTTMRVTFTIKEKANTSNTIAETIIVTGLKAETAEQELTRLAKAKLTNKAAPEEKTTDTAKVAAPKITDNTTLDSYYTRVEIAKNVTYAWKSSTAVEDSVQIVVTLNNSFNGASVDHTFSITGFTSELQAEANKFKVLIAATTAQTTTRLAARNINDVTGDTAKIAEINKLVTGFPTIDSSLYVLTIGKATVASDTATSITIQITVSEKPTAGNSKTKATLASATFTMITLTAETAEAELTRIAKAKLPTKNAQKGSGLVTTAQLAKEAIEAATNSTAELNKYYPRVTLGSGIIYAFGSAAVDSSNANVLNVTVGVINTEETNVTIQYVIKINFPPATAILK